MSASSQSGTIRTYLNRQLSALTERLTEMLLPAESISDLRSSRDWKNWANALTLEALEDLINAPTEINQHLFKAQVRLVEIEIHAKCNHTYSFCPNSIVDHLEQHLERIGYSNRKISPLL
jgi:hypothetical protein